MHNYLVIGSGIVGSAVAYGLLKRGHKVTILDEGEPGFKASRGNFGLIWCQGKGYLNKPYADITFESCRLWAEFSRELEALTGLETDYRCEGGLYYLQDKISVEQREKKLQAIYKASQEKIVYRMLSKTELQQKYPEIGDGVQGASFSPLDATCDPLKLLTVLKRAVKLLGGLIIYNSRVLSVNKNQVSVETVQGTMCADKIILAAGLSNRQLSRDVGLKQPLKPIKGQILVSQRMKDKKIPPSLQVRQTSEGTFICGDSHEDVGLDTRTSLDVIRQIAQRALVIHPFLEQIPVNRAWGALRVMTPDSLPIYERSTVNPAVYGVSCHSGVTLAAYHALQLAAFIDNNHLPSDLQTFSGSRFND
ncbi:NAD(P)/FAD-dependent oxidoreductase [Psychromonas ossibalaenae]|uniref:NAD(P)/FAD-dependent oxidoreductase n=1 Tax=Psychromonas ossibalaenae TaxID=444922 RepID=UPI00037262F9|nr:FAD-binding oxidoreductase [Psychromonas ossibalaenae]